MKREAISFLTTNDHEEMSEYTKENRNWRYLDRKKARGWFIFIQNTERVFVNVRMRQVSAPE